MPIVFLQQSLLVAEDIEQLLATKEKSRLNARRRTQGHVSGLLCAKIQLWHSQPANFKIADLISFGDALGVEFSGACRITCGRVE